MKLVETEEHFGGTDACDHRWLQSLHGIYPGAGVEVAALPEARQCLDCKRIWIRYTFWKEEAE